MSQERRGEPGPSLRRRTILHILEKKGFGTGSVQQMFQAAEGLARRGHRVTVVSRPGEELARRCREAGLELVPLPLRHEGDVGSALRLARLLRARGVEVVHAHKGIAHAVALGASYLVRLPCLVVNRGVSFPLTRWNRGKYASRRVHRVVAVCEAIRRVVVASGAVDPAKVVVIYAGTDLARFDPTVVDGSGVRRELAVAPEDVLVCQVGVRPWRGWKLLVTAMAEVVRAEPRARLLLVGCETEAVRCEVMAEASRVGVGERTTALGYRADMPEIAAALDVAVDLSTEGLGITGTLREAMAMGKPVVCSAAGGNPELVVDGVTGRLVPPGDAAAAARAILEVVHDRGKARAWGDAGRRRVETRFSAAARVAALEALYEDVLGGTPRSGGDHGA